ncbi:hypothetical protein CVT25_011595 [Psilocybe cyanescens]|uniref:RING-type domain-containing protein n=1 Tax=Psilocybe cyanescens TaxID=93625 RepID=A0A409X0R5_PSICY|nr:hypothetical protein CVT25_011595 [Psilocybe cyanescens]
MSNIAPADGIADQPEFDFWEFVCCTKCRMPFSLENGSATIPFWLTECGHVVCNNHLNRDQSCCQCGAQDIQLAPLQRQMEAPMSDWFRSIPSALESIAFTAKFQSEAMASQVRYHKSRHQQLRQIVERLKRDMSELKRSNDILQNQNEQLRHQMGYHEGGPSQGLNANGKRPMQQYELTNRRARTDSSPRSITTPVGPDRLTLLPGQQVPELSSHKQQGHNGRSHFTSNMHDTQDYVQQDAILARRPISSRSLEILIEKIRQFAYAPQGNSTFHAPQLTHAQAAPKLFQRTDNQQNVQQNQGAAATSHQHQIPPPSSSRFKPAQTLSNHAMNTPRNSTNRQQITMGPPPTPQHVRDGRSVPSISAGQHNNVQPSTSVDRRPIAAPSSTVPGQQPSLTTTRRFFAEGPNNPTAFIGHGASASTSRGPSRVSGALSNSASGTGQRTPFVAGAGQRGAFG